MFQYLFWRSNISTNDKESTTAVCLQNYKPTLVFSPQAVSDKNVQHFPSTGFLGVLRAICYTKISLCPIFPQSHGSTRGGRSHIFRLRLCSCPKFLIRFQNFRIWESDSCTDSDYHRSLREFAHFFHNKWPSKLLLLPKLISETGVKWNFWTLRNVWPVIVCQLFCFSEWRNKV